MSFEVDCLGVGRTGWCCYFLNLCCLESSPGMEGTWASQPVTTTSSVLLWLTLLCLAPAIRSNGPVLYPVCHLPTQEMCFSVTESQEAYILQKGLVCSGPPRAVLTLEPPWLDVLREDNVTLICEGFQIPGQDSTEWFHNGSALPNHHDSYVIPAVNIEDSGEYQCRTRQTALSNPVKLQVSNDWLLLQVERLEFMKGDTMILRCHSWRSKPLHKVTYYHNDEALKYHYQSFNYVVSKVNYTHSGSYACTGVMGNNLYVSATVVITVQVDTGLYFTLQREVNGQQGAL
ncbi:low affinity immunoglobulin gamma Fc region receptor III-like isoform X2 [Petaurus breviceps papuanus]|uniref:low affinity immunoglobulin gamma Fc region receptor III-like isoform X2 n=1 Tax=Petaurus breviceps papuanus TaxID=3040969 RepID=UPI0036D9881A